MYLCFNVCKISTETKTDFLQNYSDYDNLNSFTYELLREKIVYLVVVVCFKIAVKSLPLKKEKCCKWFQLEKSAMSHFRR